MRKKPVCDVNAQASLSPPSSLFCSLLYLRLFAGWSEGGERCPAIAILSLFATRSSGKIRLACTFLHSNQFEDRKTWKVSKSCFTVSSRQNVPSSAVCFAHLAINMYFFFTLLPCWPRSRHLAVLSRALPTTSLLHRGRGM